MMIDAAVAVGAASLIVAIAPATWGAAIDVPFLSSWAPTGTADSMFDPGAQRVMKDAAFE